MKKKKLKYRLQNMLGADQANLLKHSKNYLLGNFAVKALSFISAPIFTRLLLPEEYGILSVFGSITQVLTIIMLLNFHGALSRNYHEKDGSFSIFLGSISIFLLAFDLFLLSTLFVLKDIMTSFLKIGINIYYLAVISSLINAFNTLYYTYLQTSQQSKKYVIISFINSLLILILSVIWVLALKDNQYLGKIYATILTSCLILCYTIYNLIKLSTFKISFDKIKYAALFGIPLLPHAMSGFILVQFDRIIINQISGGADTGLYSVAYNIGMLMNIIVMSLNKAWSPVLYSKMNKEKHDDIKKMTINNAKLIFLFALCLILFGKEIGMVLVDQAYYDGLTLVPIIVLGYVFVYFYNVYGTYAYFRKKTLLFSMCTVVASVSNIILNYIFIPQYGYAAAAYTTLVSYAIMFTMHYISARFILKDNIPKLRNFFNSGILFVTLLIVFMLINKYNINIFASIALKLLLLGIYLFYVLNTYTKNKT